MADKRFLPSFIVVQPVAGNMATTITSAPSRIRFIDNLSYEIIWSGGTSPAGTIQVQCSNDYQETDAGVPVPGKSGTWTNIGVVDTSGNPPTISGTSGSHMIQITQLPHEFVRLQYIPTAGTGTMTVWVAGKGV
jgi:hypothetical protein